MCLALGSIAVGMGLQLTGLIMSKEGEQWDHEGEGGASSFRVGGHCRCRPGKQAKMWRGVAGAGGTTVNNRSMCKFAARCVPCAASVRPVPPGGNVPHAGGRIRPVKGLWRGGRVRHRPAGRRRHGLCLPPYPSLAGPGSGRCWRLDQNRWRWRGREREHREREGKRRSFG